MKILKRGKAPHYVYEGKCSTCKAEVQFSEGEAKTMQGDRPFDSDSKYIKCPTPNCDANIYGKRIERR